MAMLGPGEVPPLFDCGYDYCSEKGKMVKKTVPEILEEDVLSDKEKELEKVVSSLLRASAVLAGEGAPVEQPNTTAPSKSSEVPIPGGILPVESGKDLAQRVHTLVIKPDGFGYLRSPNGEERPLTNSNVDLFKAYFVRLGKILKTMKPVAGT